jgi:chemotaxis protein histidine kinase CheA
MPTLLKAKQLVLLLQDGFRALGDFAPTKNLIDTLKVELKQLKDTVAELNLCEVSILVEKLEPLLTVVPPDLELNSPVYSSENIQIIHEALRIVANHLEEASEPNNINIPDVASVLDMLYQQKSVEAKLMAETQAVPPATQIAQVPAQVEKTTPVEQTTTPSSQIGTPVENIVSDKTPETLPEFSAEPPTAVPSNNVESTNRIAVEPRPSWIARGNEGRGEPAKLEEKIEKPEPKPVTIKSDLENVKLPPVAQNNLYLILHSNGKLLALPYQKVEKVQKLALSDLKLIRNDILANIEGSEIAMYDLTTLFGSGSDDENSEKETFLTAICQTENGKIGLLFDAVRGCENLVVSKFHSILGKLKGIAGISAVRMKNQNSEESEQYQPVFVLEPAELNSIFQSQPD